MITASISPHIRWHSPSRHARACKCLGQSPFLAVLPMCCVCFFCANRGDHGHLSFPKSCCCSPNYLHVILDIFGRLLMPLSRLPFGWHCLVSLTRNNCHASLRLEFHLLSDLPSLVTGISLSEDHLSGIRLLNLTCANHQHPFFPSLIDSMLWKYLSSGIHCRISSNPYWLFNDVGLHYVYGTIKLS